MTDWGLPDWRNPELYEASATWDESRWRWEFLRRRADYRADFEKALSAIPDPLALPEDVLEDTSFWLFGDGMRTWPFMHAGARRYGLLELYDPVVSDWMSSGPEWHSGLVYGGFEGEEMIVGEDGGYEDIKASHMVAFTFNLKRPLAPQLKEVARQLEQGQFNYLAYGAGAPEKMGTEEAEKLAMHLVQSPKAHREKWPVYLRALDAHEAGASLSEIAEILPPRYGRRDQKAAHNVLEQARTLQFRF